MKSKDSFVSIPVKSERLKKHIAYFYFHANTQDRHEESYVFYPNYKLALTIYKDSSVHFENRTSTTKPGRKTSHHVYSGYRNHSVLVNMTTPFNKIGIVFHPLGINHFIDQPFKTLHPSKDKIEMNFFHQSMEETVKQVFAENDHTQKAALLEEYFEQQLVSFNEQRLIDSVDFILNSKFDITVESVSEALNINRKTLLRLFNKHLDCSVKEFIDIVKFRKAIDLYQATADKPKLTQIAYETGYYDQSNFIRNFKKVTGMNPKSLFKNIDHFGAEATFWTSLSKNK